MLKVSFKGSTQIVGKIVSDSLWPHGLYPTRVLCPWDSPGKNTGVGCHSLLQRIFPTQGLNSGLLHYRRILYHLSYRNAIVSKSRYLIYTVEYYSVIKKNKIMPFEATLMNLPTECHTEWSKSDRAGEILYDSPYMWNLKRNDKNELTYKTERDS